MTDYQVLEKFIRWHVPNFTQLSDGWWYCKGQKCNDCKCVDECGDGKCGFGIGVIGDEDYLKFKEEYPEFMI